MYMIGLTKRSHVAPKMQHVTFCDSIVRLVLCITKRTDTVCGVTWIPLCARDGSMIAWGRGEGRPCRFMSCRLSVREALPVWYYFDDSIKFHIIWKKYCVVEKSNLWRIIN